MELTDAVAFLMALIVSVVVMSYVWDTRAFNRTHPPLVKMPHGEVCDCDACTGVHRVED